MKQGYRQLSENIRTRLNPEGLAFSQKFSSDLATISYSDVLVFIRTAMKAPEPAYTQKTKLAGERAKGHLESISSVTFRYQGSVMTNTHIQGFSDIDLLTISEKFYYVDHPGIDNVLTNQEVKRHYWQGSIDKLLYEKNIGSYQGNAISDLYTLRMDCERILGEKYLICDKSKPKSIKIKNQDLHREVDVVVASWFDDVSSIINNRGSFRGVQVFNKDTFGRETPDYPFLSIERINQRGDETQSRLRKMIRFLKNVKGYATVNIELSSFDINAVCYDIEVASYQNLAFYQLVPVLYHQLSRLARDTAYADRLVSVDGKEYIFRGKPGKLESLRKLLNEVEGIYVDFSKAAKPWQ